MQIWPMAHILVSLVRKLFRKFEAHKRAVPMRREPIVFDLPHGVAYRESDQPEGSFEDVLGGAVLGRVVATTAEGLPPKK